MIDEKKLIETLEKRKRKATAFSDIDWNSALKVCIDIVKEQPKVGEWIPVSERMPEETDYYLATVKGATESTELYFSCQTGLWSDELENIYHVIAWQVLPPAYEGK